MTGSAGVVEDSIPFGPHLAIVKQTLQRLHSVASLIRNLLPRYLWSLFLF